MQKLIAVSVGTDHHKFDRLVDWAAEWGRDHPDVRVVIQRGTAAEVEGVECPETLPHDDLRQLFADADAVVCHGGPSTVMDARQAGTMPIVMPRDPAFDEHVDGHQLAFAEHMKRHGLAKVVHTRDDLFESIEAGIADSSHYRIDKSEHSLNGVVAFGAMLDELLDTETGIYDPEDVVSAQEVVTADALAAAVANEQSI